MSTKPRNLKVFLCHSSGDKTVVRALYERLRSDDFDPWLDEEQILPGQDWDREITKAVRDSDIVIVCLSSSSINKAGYVQKEIKFALDVADQQPDGAIFLIPAKLDECGVPERLQRWQWVSLYEEGGYPKLTRSLLRRAKDLGLVAKFQEVRVEAPPKSKFEGVSFANNLNPDTHIRVPCDLTSGETYNIDLKSNGEVDLLIMDWDDYRAWDRGKEYEVYKEFLDRHVLHAFFKARESRQYVVVVNNESDERFFIELAIGLA